MYLLARVVFPFSPFRPRRHQLGLNLADNEITDRGASLLSVCLQHNATLCALVLDGNTEISQEAEKRITEELETRSMMPEVCRNIPAVLCVFCCMAVHRVWYLGLLLSGCAWG